MQSSTCGVNSIADQRYFHFLTFLEEQPFRLSTYFRGEVFTPGRSVSYRDSFCFVEHHKLCSSERYARGEVADSLSEKGHGRPPYFYDVLTARSTVGGTPYVLLGFPFVSLARQVTARMFDRTRRFRPGTLQRADVARLFAELEAGARVFEGLHTSIVGVSFKVADEICLTTVRISGDQPLKAEVYENYLKPKIGPGLISPNECTVACYRSWSGSTAEDGAIDESRSRVRVDAFGNMRFYVHVNCNNLRLISYLFRQLAEFSCLRTASQNPLDHVEQDEMALAGVS